ncbi:MAG TPA: hypothetical protein VEB21_09660 [Terriglobales bacterium]|nr:hypothetical protein [Terriglobales bacterium]
MRRLVTVVTAGVITLLFRTAALGAPIRLDPGDLSHGINFGHAVGISGDTAIVSAHQSGDSVGAAYVFAQVDGVWNLQQKLVAADASPGSFFGTSIAIDGDTVAVGAPGGQDRKGATYVFTRAGATWSQQQKLEAPDGEAGDDFGTSVRISGDSAIIGAPDIGSGAAYVFVRTGQIWSLEQKLVVETAVASDGIGNDVAIDADTAIVAALHDNEAAPDSGAAYVFVREGGVWTLQAKLMAADSFGYELIGTAVAVSGGTAVVGAHYGFAAGVVTGAAYVFRRSGTTWSEEQKLTAFDGSAHDDFGWAVGIAGDVAIGGGDADDETNGSAHVYVRKDGAWYHQRELTVRERHGNFGYSAATSPSIAVVGAPHANGSGAAYVFDLDTTLAHPAAGKRLLIKNAVPDDARRNRINGTLEDTELWLPVPYSSTDPTVSGAVLRVESATSGQSFEQLLPAANWQRRGAGQPKASYRYVDGELDDGPCKKVTLTRRKVSFTCGGKGPFGLGYDLVGAETQAPVRVTMQFTPGVGYCAELGGLISLDGTDGRSFKAKQAPAPVSCD